MSKSPAEPQFHLSELVLCSRRHPPHLVQILVITAHYGMEPVYSCLSQGFNAAPIFYPAVLEHELSKVPPGDET